MPKDKDTFSDERLRSKTEETLQEELSEVEHGRKGLFRNVGFIIFSTSQAASLLGDKIGYMALLAMVAAFYPKTSPQILSTFSVVIALPTLILGPISLFLIDRWSRRRVLIISDVARMILTLGSPILLIFLPNYWFMIAFLLLYFTFSFTFNTVRCSVIPDLVSKEHLHGANSFINLINRVTTFVGMLGGGVLVSLAVWDKVGIPRWSSGFFLDGFTFAVSVIALLSLNVKSHLYLRRVTMQETTSKITSSFRDMIEVVRYIARTPAVLAVAGSIILFGILNALVFVVMIPIIQKDFAMQTWGVGVMGGVAAVGLLLGSVLYGFFGKRLPKVKTIFLSYGIIGLGVALLSVFPSPWVLGGVAFVGGILYTVINIAQDTLLQEEVPNVIRGRIFSAREWLYMGSFMGGSLLLGLSAFVAHKYLLLAVCGGFFVASCLWGYIYIQLKKRNPGGSG